MKTTRLWMMAAILTCGAMTANAQDTKHEVGISIGAGSNSQVLGFLEDVEALTVSAGQVGYDNEKNVGPISVEYFYHISPKIGIGGIAAFANTKKDATVAGKKEGEAKMTYLTVMPAVKLGWFEREHVGMYSKLAAGLTVRSEKQDFADYSKSTALFNFQVSLIGLEVGSKKVRAFAELGAGEQGIILGGVRCKF